MNKTNAMRQLDTAKIKYEPMTYEVDENGYRYTPEGDDTYSKNSGMYFSSLNQLGMGVAGNLENPPAALNKGLTNLRERYEELNKEFAQYAVADPCYPLVSDTNVAFGSDLSTKISDAAVQYIAGLINEDELKAVWDEWAEMGGNMIIEEYQAAYDAMQAE